MVALSGLATPIIGKVFAEIYAAGKAKYEQQLAAMATTRAAANLYKKILTIEKVKTIWQVDKPVNLRRFYYPSKILIEDQRIPIDSLSDLKSSESHLIVGTIGQGKSTLLRYLCLKELEKGERFPLFVELRRITKEASLTDMLKSTLQTLGLKQVDDDLFQFLAESGKLVVFLDGFDELPPDKIPSVLHGIEYLIHLYPIMQIIVTSRPNSGIEQSAHLNVIRIAPLQPIDFDGFLRKVQNKKEERERLLAAINQSASEISALLKTPLMLTLLVLSYRSTSAIPQDMSDFYESLFSTLISRHDKSKPGYTRHRYCDLSDRELQILFEAFCFISRTKSLSVIIPDALYEITKKASDQTRLECTDQQFKDEITKVACLLVEEGGKLYFLHKSVQEYYAAMFVKRSSDAFARSFYGKILSRVPHDWEQELAFLRQVDSHRFNKYFFIPGYEKFFNNLGIKFVNDNPIVDSRSVRNICAPLFFQFKADNDTDYYAPPRSASWSYQVEGGYYHFAYVAKVSTETLKVLQGFRNYDADGKFSALFTYPELEKIPSDAADGDTDLTFKFTTLADYSPKFLEQVLDEVRLDINSLHKTFLEQKLNVKREEEKAAKLIDFDSTGILD